MNEDYSARLHAEQDILPMPVAIQTEWTRMAEWPDQAV